MQDCELLQILRYFDILYIFYLCLLLLFFSFHLSNLLLFVHLKHGCLPLSFSDNAHYGISHFWVVLGCILQTLVGEGCARSYCITLLLFLHVQLLLYGLLFLLFQISHGVDRIFRLESQPCPCHGFLWIARFGSWSPPARRTYTFKNRLGLFS